MDQLAHAVALCGQGAEDLRTCLEVAGIRELKRSFDDVDAWQHAKATGCSHPVFPEPESRQIGRRRSGHCGRRNRLNRRKPATPPSRPGCEVVTRTDDIEQLKAMAAKARQLARGTTDPMTLDILERYAEECEEQVSRLRSLRDGRH